MPTEAATTRPVKARFRADDLRAVVAGIFAARGVAKAGAAAVADALVWANLHGIDSHGVSRVPRYLELFDQGNPPRTRCRRSSGRGPRWPSWTRTPRQARSR